MTKRELQICVKGPLETFNVTEAHIQMMDKHNLARALKLENHIENNNNNYQFFIAPFS